MNYEARHYLVLSTFLSLHPFRSKHSAKHLYPDVRHFKFTVCSSFNMRDQVSHTTGNTILFVYFNINPLRPSGNYMNHLL
jgi:hypothetical protein